MRIVFLVLCGLWLGASLAETSASVEIKAAKEANRSSAAPLYLKAAQLRVAEAKELFAKEDPNELSLEIEDDELSPGGSATDATRQKDAEARHYLQTAVDFDYGGRPLVAEEWFKKALSVSGVSSATTDAIRKEQKRIAAERDPTDAPDPKPPKKPVYHQALEKAKQKGDWSEIGYQAFLDFNPDLAKEARQAVEKSGRKPGSYAYLWTKMPEAYENLKTFPRAEEATRTPKTLADFGVNETRTIVVGEIDWDAEDATACVEEALASDATTIVFENKGSPWYVRTIKPRGNQRLVFKKGVRILKDRVSRQNRDTAPLIDLKDVRNVIIEGEGGPSDVYVGAFESLAARKTAVKDYGGDGIRIASVRNCVIRNLTVAANANDGICVGGGFEVWVENVVLRENYRQAMSVCNAGGLYCRNVSFLDTQGGEPQCGIDFEPTYETEANYDCYFYDCAFSGNRGGAVNWSSSSYYPVTAHFKRCRFGDQPFKAQITIFARCGVYMEHNVRAPSKIVLENIEMESKMPTIPVFFSNANLFDVEVKGLKAKNALPITFGLNRDYSMFPYYDHAAHQGRVTLTDVALEGPKGQPLVAFEDKVGTYSVSGLSGSGTMNGEKVDASAFSYVGPEKDLKEQPRFDSLKLKGGTASVPSATDATERVPPAVHRPAGFFFVYSGAWYSGGVNYRAVYYDNGWKAKKILPGDTIASLGLDKFPVAYSARGGDSLFKIEGPKPFRVYFEVPPKGTPSVLKSHSWSGRVRDAAGQIVKEIPKSESATYVTCEASGEKGEVWSVEFDGPAIFKFFAPMTGLIAESPEEVPRNFNW